MDTQESRTEERLAIVKLTCCLLAMVLPLISLTQSSKVVFLLCYGGTALALAAIHSINLYEKKLLRQEHERLMARIQDYVHYDCEASFIQLTGFFERQSNIIQIPRSLSFRSADPVIIRANISEELRTQLGDQERRDCRFYSSSRHLRCAVNPLAKSCEGCRDYEPIEGIIEK